MLARGGRPPRGGRPLGDPLAAVTEARRRGGRQGVLLELARSAPEIVVLIADSEGRIEWANEAALCLAGPPDGTGARKSLGALFAVADAKTVEGLLRGAPGRHGPRLLNLVDAAGSPVTVRAMLESGSGLRLAGVRAVEDERRLGDELVRLNNDLAAATRESARRGRELEKALGELRRTQALLVHREKMASLGQTTAGVAHEINNPLAFVLANTETLSRDFEDLFGFVNAVGDSLDELRVLAPAVAPRDRRGRRARRSSSLSRSRFPGSSRRTSRGSSGSGGSSRTSGRSRGSTRPSARSSTSSRASRRP